MKAAEYVMRKSVGKTKRGMRRAAMTASAMCTLTVLAPWAAAQGIDRTGVGNDVVVETIIVTAQKREQDLLDVPISVAVLSGDELKDRVINNYEDLAVAVPGLISTGGGNESERYIFIRGLANFSGPGPLVGLYLNEAPLSMRSDGQLGARLYDLERVEVLKGPQGTLYGQSSVGGTVRFITKQPRFNEFEAALDAQASFTEGGGDNQEIEGVVNIPLVTDELAIRLAGHFDRQGGWIDEPAANRTDINTADAADVRLTALWQPTERFSADLLVNVNRSDIDGRNTANADGNYIAPFGVTAAQAVEEEFEIYNLTGRYDFGLAELISSTTYIDQTTLTANWGRRFQTAPAPTAPLGQFYPRADRYRTAFSQEIRLTGESGPVNWTAGLFYRDFVYESEFISLSALDDGTVMVPPIVTPPFPEPAPGFRVTGTREDSDSWAVFGNVAWTVSDRLEVGGGLRYFEDDAAATNRTTGFVDQEVFTKLSPLAYALYKLSDNVSLYGSIAQGFRSGRFNSNPVFPEVGPEVAWSYELGLKGNTSNGFLGGEIAVFFVDYADIQTSGSDPETGLSARANAGDGELLGVEAAVDLQLTDSLSVFANGSYTDTEITSQKLLNPPIELGDRFDYAPLYQFTLGARYAFDIVGRSGSGLLTYAQQGAARLHFRGFASDLVEESDELNRLNLNVTVELSDSLTLGVFATNLLDEYDRQAPKIGGSQGFAHYTAPRTVGVRLSVDF